MEGEWEGDGVKVWGHSVSKDKGTAEPQPGLGRENSPESVKAL